MSFIEFSKVSFAWPGASRPAVDAVDLSVEEGEYLAITGRNGSGKSSLLRLMNGLRSASSGLVRVGGRDASDPAFARELRSTVVLVFQSPPDQIVSTVVEEDVAFGPENLGLDRAEIGRRVGEALAVVGLEAERQSPTHVLSAGQQQRLAVAGALAMAPRCIAFDEATAMLDPPSRATMLDLMDRLSAEGVTIIHVTHDMAEAARARRVIVMEEGRIVADGSPSLLFEAESRGRPWEPGPASLPPSVALARFLGMEARAGESPPEAAERIDRALRQGRISGRPPQLRPDFPPGSHTVASEAAFVLENVFHSYLRSTLHERRALTDLSISLPRGSSLALVGHTGSGKSTLLQLMNSLAMPSEGRVLTFGVNPCKPGVDLRKLRMRAPLAIQRPESALFEPFAGDDVAFGPRNQGLSGSELVARVRRAMDRVDLPFEDFRDRGTRALSGGERRRLALAGVLALEPEGLLLDEPTQALDPAGKAGVMGLIRDFRDRGGSVAFATHSMEEARVADLVAVLSKGRLVAFGDPAAVFVRDYDPAWGIGRPFACEVGLALEARGYTGLRGNLGPERLAAALLDLALAKALAG